MKIAYTDDFTWDMKTVCNFVHHAVRGYWGDCGSLCMGLLLSFILFSQSSEKCKNKGPTHSAPPQSSEAYWLVLNNEPETTGLQNPLVISDMFEFLLAWNGHSFQTDTGKD